MAKSSNTERARRINAAHTFIRKYDTTTQAVSAMKNLYGISRRQAYRYIHEAQKIGAHIPVPEPKIAFTVKLAPKLIHALRKYSKQSGLSLSEIVTQALDSFLRKGRRSGKKQENIQADSA